MVCLIVRKDIHGELPEGLKAWDRHLGENTVPVIPECGSSLHQWAQRKLELMLTRILVQQQTWRAWAWIANSILGLMYTV